MRVCGLGKTHHPILQGETDRIRTSSPPQSAEETPPFISESHTLKNQPLACPANQCGKAHPINATVYATSSAVVRALLRHAAQQETARVREQLFPFIEGEITAGTVWGKKRD